MSETIKETVDMVLELTGAKREEVSFVGDRIYTDVKTGVANGAHGILVLTGETKPEDIPKSDVVPDAVFTGLKEMGELLGENEQCPFCAHPYDTPKITNPHKCRRPETDPAFR